MNAERSSKTIAGCNHHQSLRVVSPKRRRITGSWACAIADPLAQLSREAFHDLRNGGVVRPPEREPAGIFKAAVAPCQCRSTQGVRVPKIVVRIKSTRATNANQA